MVKTGLAKIVFAVKNSFLPLLSPKCTFTQFLGVF